MVDATTLNHCFNHCSKKLISLQLYHKLVSFVMSYSFTDNGGSEDEEDEEVDILCKTSMVPVIDLLNHHHAHSAELDFQCDHLALTAVRDIKKVCAMCCAMRHKLILSWRYNS